MTSPDLFFVYGTLKKGYGNNRLLRTSEFLGEAVSCLPIFNMCCVGFPYLFVGGDSYVKGEIWRVTSDEVRQNLDWLEGYPTHYTRAVHEFVSPDYEGPFQQAVQAWVYLNPRSLDYDKSNRKVEPDANLVLEWGGRSRV